MNGTQQKDIGNGCTVINITYQNVSFLSFWKLIGLAVTIMALIYTLTKGA